ncbi:MAG: hypothetical protein A2Y82_02235 [Candidatus Buchananbacteria bacterium RBG_13_36_9]|uniref:Uncharacterized protein n=1 Tax=Candidatus Buchananbacteria bacterium RBG_13_36_9 TaxID=1797530 RepID=A0A1G1XNK6_9BACT|nr:MAG: hypothetical protein A2Y82_02235 [Candidatus Buchananbacteria bacterium RBG_13_36_9]
MKATAKVFFLFFALILALGVGMACVQPNEDPSGIEKPAPNPVTDLEFKINLKDLSYTPLEDGSAPDVYLVNKGEMNVQLIIPGLNPNEIRLYGTAINRQTYWPSVGVDYTGSVIGGVLTVTLRVPVNTYLHIGYSLAGQNRVNSIRINGTLLTSFMSLGTAPSQWPVACFIANRDQAGAVTIGGNPNCTAQLYRLRVRTNGDENNNNVYDAAQIYEDPMVPYNGSSVEEYQYMQTSMWYIPNPGGIWQRLGWNTTITPNSYEETFYSVLSDMDFWFTLHHIARDPTAPAGTYEPQLAVKLDVMPAAGGAVLCTATAQHVEDVDLGGTFWMAYTVQGINTGTSCPIQGVANRDIAVGTVTNGP